MANPKTIGRMLLVGAMLYVSASAISHPVSTSAAEHKVVSTISTDGGLSTIILKVVDYTSPAMHEEIWFLPEMHFATPEPVSIYRESAQQNVLQVCRGPPNR